MAQGLGRWGLGPVFASEWRSRSRRWQGYALRSAFVGALLAALALAWLTALGSGGRFSTQQLAEVGRTFFGTLTVLELSIVLLAAPAATAGAICLDKARGTLMHVLVTDLTDAEIILGKLGARLVPVLNLVACALPVAALGALLGGIDPVALAGSFLIAASLAALGCSLALALSVYASKAQEVMTALFAIWAAWLLELPVAEFVPGGGRAAGWLERTNPFWLAMARYSHPGETTLVEPALFALACLAASAGLVALAVARLRPVYLRQAGRPPLAAQAKAAVPSSGQDPAWTWGGGPSLDRNPVLWREWHRARPSRWIRIVWRLYAVASVAGGVAILVGLVASGSAVRSGDDMAAVFSGAQVTLGLLLLAASAATSLAEERARGSLDVILTTPLATRSIVFAKWWGVFRRTPWLAVLPGLIAIASLSGRPGPGRIAAALLVPVAVIAQAAALASLGLALATWIPRAGRATTWTVAAFVATVIGWPIVGFRIPGGGLGRVRGEALQWIVCDGSPFWNVGGTTFMLRPGPADGQFLAGLIGVLGWSIAYALAAAALYLAALLTFDRCLGRSPERPQAPRAGPPRAARAAFEG